MFCGVASKKGPCTMTPQNVTLRVGICLFTKHETIVYNMLGL